MRKIISIISLTISFFVSAQTDTAIYSKTYYGFQVGTVKSNVSGEEIVLQLDNSGATLTQDNGLEISLLIKHPINNYIYFKSGLGYYRRNAKIEGSSIKYALEGPFDFLNIPLQLGFQPVNIHNTQAINIGFEAGIGINFVQSSDGNLTQGLYPNANETDLKSIAPSLLIGGNIEIPISKTSFLFSIIS
jgi:hypothetical protein